VADTNDLTLLDTSANPTADMHTLTIADAVANRKPTLVLFAAPGYCTSSLCGPEYEIMRKIYPQYRDRVQFIHVEFYENPSSSGRGPVQAAKEWGLQTEPWFFVVDAGGAISAKFEGPTGLSELEAALKAVSPG
jgi:hypothetical protein